MSNATVEEGRVREAFDREPTLRDWSKAWPAWVGFERGYLVAEAAAAERERALEHSHRDVLMHVYEAGQITKGEYEVLCAALGVEVTT